MKLYQKWLGFILGLVLVVANIVVPSSVQAVQCLEPCGCGVFTGADIIDSYACGIFTPYCYVSQCNILCPGEECIDKGAINGYCEASYGCWSVS